VTGGALAGVAVLVTRPAAQARRLCQRIAAAGGEPVPWPALDIVALPASAASEHALIGGSAPDWVIFVSANAVRHGLSRVPPGVPLAAIGPATAAALEAAGRPAALTAARADSEGLLADPMLARVAGLRFVIVRGVGGREALAEGLRARGARVGYEEVYRRARPAVRPDDRDALIERWRAGGVQVYTATSVEILNNLHDMLGAEGGPLLAATPLVTASARVVQQAERRGHRSARLLASRPDDDALTEAITNWRSGACAARGSGGSVA
jgi:uroporphyrinogen-III synthase